MVYPAILNGIEEWPVYGMDNIYTAVLKDNPESRQK
jgi:hypothetical protein